MKTKFIILSIFSLFLIGFMLFNLNNITNTVKASYLNNTFQDSEFDEALDWMHNSKLTKYNKSNEFRPIDSLTREQAASFFDGFASTIGKDGQDNLDCDFDDLDDADETLIDNIQNVCKLGIMKGSGNKFYPKKSINRAEFFTVVVRTLDSFKNEGLDPWWKEYFETAQDLGLTNEDNVYAQDRNILRYEAGLILYRAKNETNLNNLKDPKVEEQEEQERELKSFQIDFEQSMDTKSVLSNMRIYPEIEYELVWSENDSIAEIAFSNNFDEDTEVLVNISDDAKNSNGEKLTQTLSKKFKVDSAPQIDFVSPEGIITDVNKNITVRFTSPMVSFTNLDNQAECPIQITPNIDGKCVWITTSTFQFRPVNSFPRGANYSIYIPSGIENISGNKTINSKKFEIKTPDFELISSPKNINKDDDLVLVFNDKIDLDKFKNNFSISNFDNSELDFEYAKKETNIDGQYDVLTNSVSIFPKNGDWGYNKKYQISINSSLTSKRGNLGLKQDISKSFITDSFLSNYSLFIYEDLNYENLNLEGNMRFSNFKNIIGNDIINKNNPNILLYFNEEVPLDKSLFELDYDFDLSYFLIEDNEQIVEDKKSLVLSINGNISNSLDVKIKASQISSSDDINLSFTTKEKNKILDFEMINYKKSCITFENKIHQDEINYDAFDFSEYGNVRSIQEIYKYHSEQACSYEVGKNKYLLYTNLNPETDYVLNISNNLLDIDNYNLDKDYSYEFKTPKAMNEDKNVSFIDQQDLVLIPSSINPITVGIATTNIEKVNIKVCQGDLELISNNKFSNSNDCKEKILNIENLGFEPKITVIDLQKVFGKEFGKNLISFEISKIDADKTKRELENDSNLNKSFFVSDISATLKNAKNSLLWLRDYNNGNNLTDQIEKIEIYNSKYNYDQRKYFLELEKEIAFNSLGNGLYKFFNSIDGASLIVITLKSGQKTLIKDISYFYGSKNINTYLFTDRPLYRAGDEVNIKGVSRIQDANGYILNRRNFTLTVTGPKREEIFKKSINLDENSSFDVTFELPQDSNLGNYNVSAGANGGHTFSVQEFETPDFKVESDSQESNYLQGQSAKINISSEYYSGLPMANANVNYTVKAQTYNFDAVGYSDYHFGEQKDFWGYRYNYGQINNNEFVESGEDILGSDGKGVINIDLKEYNEDKIYTVSSIVKDPNTKKTVSNNSNFKSLRSDIFLGMKFDNYFYNYKDTTNIDFVSLDIDGNSISNTRFDFKVYKVDYEYDKISKQRKSKENLLYEEEIVSNGQGKASKEFEFNEVGEYRFEIITKDGKYKTTKIFYIGAQGLLSPINENNEISINSNKEKYDVGENAEFIISSPYENIQALVTVEKMDQILNYEIIDIDDLNQVYNLKIEKRYLPNFEIKAYLIKDVAVNQTALQELKEIRLSMQEIEQELQERYEGIIIPFPEIIYDRGILPPIFPIPQELSDEDKELYEKLSSYRYKEQELMQEILPSYYEGSKKISVNIDYVKLNIQVNLNKNYYLPRDEQEITLTIEDNNGNPVNGQATIRIVDESLLALMDNTVDIVEAFYSEVENRVGTSSNLSYLISRILFTQDSFENELEGVPDGMGGEMLKREEGVVYSEMSFGDASIANLGLDSTDNEIEDNNESEDNNETFIREDFKDLAYWQASVDVKNGQAVINVDQLPDNLTTWVIDGFVYTDNTYVGMFQDDFKVQQDIGILSQFPRFLVSGDEFIMSALIVNNTNQKQVLDANLQMTNSNISQSNKQIEVPANSSELVEFEVKINSLPKDVDINEFNSQIILGVSNENLSDTIRVNRAIRQPSTGEYVFTNGSTKDTSFEEQIYLPDYLEKNAHLDISLGASILTNILHNLQDYISYPGDNLNSRLNFLEISSSLKNLFEDLGEIDILNSYQIKDYDGNTYSIKDIENMILSELPEYLESNGGLSYFKECYWADDCSNFNLTAKFLKLDLQVNGIDNSKLINYYKNQLTQKIQKYNIIAKNVSNFIPLAIHGEYDYIRNNLKNKENYTNLEKLEYIKLYNLMSDNGEYSDKFYQDLLNNIFIEARSSLLPSNSNYINNLVSTSMMLSIMLDKSEIEKLQTENMTRFLLENRNEDGKYYNGDISYIIKALNDYVNTTNELDDVDFTAGAYLNENLISETEFDMSNRFSVFKDKIDISELVNWGENNSLGFVKEGSGKLYYDVGMRYFLPNNEISARDEGLILTRNYYDYEEYNEAYEKKCNSWWWGPAICTNEKVKNIDPITNAKKGNYIVGELQLIVPYERNNVQIKDYLPAGAEVLNVNFDTVSDDVNDVTGQTSNYWRGFDHIEQGNEMIYLYADHLSAGTYTYTYVISASQVGEFNLRPAVAELIERPEIWGRSSGMIFEINN
ncbi:alpha-2-macroglobulin [Candidatus Vampirococcus lugosii]|uniref:Alpha-2-macroglobulin n=2 Tax=Candidatus Vampirococcus lugosii TaxID=2789015 RepID=A0ABS5QJU5_9BACT|nr:alpha-2-macroglobulin [Candidatus Vampirococcus lugosii]